MDNIGALIDAAGWWSYLLVFAMTVGETSAFIGILLPGETTVLVAAALAGSGHLNPVALAVLVVVGGIIGDSLGFALGHWYERRPGGRRLHDRINPDGRIARAESFLLRHGGVAVFTGRFIGVVRTFLPFVAGAIGMPYLHFVLYSGVASLVWGLGNVLLGYFAGAAAIDVLHSAGLPGALTLVLLAATLTAAVHLIRRIRTHRRLSPAPAVSTPVPHGGLRQEEPTHVSPSSQKG